MKKNKKQYIAQKRNAKWLEYIGKSFMVFKEIQMEPVSNFFFYYIIGKKMDDSQY